MKTKSQAQLKRIMAGELPRKMTTLPETILAFSRRSSRTIAILAGIGLVLYLGTKIH